MAHKSVVEFLSQAEQDPKLRAAVEAVQIQDKRTAISELVKIAETAGFVLSAQALEAGLRELAPMDLGDDDLEHVGGGASGTTKPKPAPSPKSGSSSAFGKFYTHLHKTIPCV